MNNNVKQIIRKNKILNAFSKSLYHAGLYIKRYPADKKRGTRLLQKLKNVDTERHNIWYFGVPTHKNLGDQAQRCCITSWVKENYPDSDIVEITSRAFNINQSKIMPVLKKLIKPSDLIIMQSGYTMTGIHPDEISHRVITETFSDNKVLFFPQTILFYNEKLKNKTVSAIDKNKNTILLTRDTVSFETAKNLYKNITVDCYPDIVTSQIGKYDFNSKRDGILFCMRNDAEQYYERSEVLKLIERLKTKSKVELTDTTVDGIDFSTDCDSIWNQILSVIESYSKYELIITDRYHGTIFSLIAGTPVIVLKTNDHKVSTGVDWFKGIYDSHIFAADSLKHAELIANDLLGKELAHKLDNYFDREYYKKLKAKFLGD